MAAKISSLQDIPVKNRDEELLGLEVYATALSDFIINCDTPITIGIQGDWGIGKTSLLNLIAENLRPRSGRQKTFTVVRVETWQFSQFQQEEFLPLAVLGSINNSRYGYLPADKVEKHQKVFREIFKKTGTFLVHAANQVLKEKIGVDAKEAYEKTISEDQQPVVFMDISREVIRIRSQFETIINEIVPSDEGSKVVIMIDDLDRIKPVKALELLEVIKVFLDAPKCVFVLAVDYSVIERGAEQKLGKNLREFYGKSYFDKIIQVPFNMPVSSYRTDRYIMSMLGWEFDPDKGVYYFDKEKSGAFLSGTGMQSLKKDIAEFFSNITRLSAGNNPRTIKRIVNYANLLRLIWKSTRASSKGARWEVDDAKIVYAIACMQLTWPELFHFFVQNPSPVVFQRLEDMNYLADLPDLKRMFTRYPDPNEEQSKISGFFDEFISLIDKNGNNEISTEEFMPIWRILQDTNLTNIELVSPAKQWDQFGEMVNVNNKRLPATTIQNMLDLFKKSAWSNSLSMRLVPAGKKFSNLMWNQTQIGSLVSTQAECFQFYINDSRIPVEQFIEKLSPECRTYFENQENQRHYGTGNLKLKILELSDQPDRIKIMNEIINTIDQLI